MSWKKEPLGSTKSLLYWQFEWLKRFLLTWYHIFNRKAYWNWKAQKKADQTMRLLKSKDKLARFELEFRDHQF